MDCRKVQELLIRSDLREETDTILDPEVQGHLEVCPSCRTFYKEFFQTLVRPFKEAGPVQPPESVWLKIKAAIEKEPQKRPAAEVLLDRFKAAWDRILGIMPKPVLGGVGLAAVFLIAALLIYVPKGSLNGKAYLGDQMLYLMGVSSEDLEFQAETESLGTAIEVVFLD
ncbi:MAG: hypothetical protein NC930_08730 [Candidatus Omnitrophica bacterium]|nr:hypothetical protein [Candidatus Omnitrophota bacterium]